MDTGSGDAQSFSQGDYESIRFWSQKTCFLTPMTFKNQCVINFIWAIFEYFHSLQGIHAETKRQQNIIADINQHHFSAIS
jgi:hypothetical protein